MTYGSLKKFLEKVKYLPDDTEIVIKCNEGYLHSKSISKVTSITDEEKTTITLWEGKNDDTSL